MRRLKRDEDVPGSSHFVNPGKGHGERAQNMDDNTNGRKLPVGLAGLALLAGAGIWLARKQRTRPPEQPDTLFDERPFLERHPDARYLTPDELAIAEEEERLRRQQLGAEMLSKMLQSHHDMSMNILRNMTPRN
jgi:hypothetical protein